ncbi:hypothetical protein BKA63DRAFT_26289 [Paraphoma chrysanthemicola]|nr:hypothetical protein BKA63DRAFT_26289 [Paraphoma chrysanthemicola]
MLCAQTEARGVFKAMQIALPQELCDYIWSHLVPRNTVQGADDVFFENFPSESGRNCFNHFDYCLPPAPPLPPCPYPLFPPWINADPARYVEPDLRIFSPTHISAEIAIEAAKSFYANNTFMLTAQCELRSLSQLLTVDRLGLELQPFTLIRKIHLRLPSETCSWHRKFHQESDARRRARLRQYHEALIRTLVLMPIEHCPIVELTITIIILACPPHHELLAQERNFAQHALSHTYDRV